MNKKFFLISQVFYPDEVSTAGLFTNLCEEIAKKEVVVEVWCSQPSYNIRKRQPKKLNYNGINISYLASTNFNKNSILGRLLNYTTFSISLIFRILFTSDKTPLFTSTNPPYLGFLVTLFASLKKRKVYYIIQDVFPDGIIKLGKIKEKGLVANIWHGINRYTLKKAEKVIVIGRDMIPVLSKTHKHLLSKVIYIPIWQDAELINPQKFTENSFVKEHKLEDKFVVQYSGNMGLWNDMKTYGLAANKLKSEDILFTFIGDGIRKKELIKALGDPLQQNVLFLPFQPKENLSNSLTACHVALISLNKGLEGIAVPSKIMGILAAGIPSIALVPKSSEIAQIIQEAECGIVIEPGNVDDLVEAIKNMRDNHAERKRLALNARMVFLQKFNTNKIAEEYIQLLY
ncbi:MAG: glycosyltransferase family 4 protein [Spirochaetales bacterium]|nr:glycosyltransferase family 4 protein [Spirochaetales bacterium]